MEKTALQQGLEQLDREVLARFIVELAASDGEVARRAEALTLRGAPGLLAKVLRGQLSGFRRGRRLVPYGESFAFASRLGAWVEEVETGLLDERPGVAAELLEGFIRLDTKIFGRVDDSSGAVGDAFHHASKLFLQALGRLPPSPERADRIRALHEDNDYGVRDSLLDHIAHALDESEIRRLVEQYRERAIRADDGGEHYDGLTARVAIKQLAWALRDAELLEESVRLGSPEPNHLQRREMAAAHLKFGSAERAVELLKGTQYVDLLIDALSAVGDADGAVEARRRRFEATLDVAHLNEYRESLPSSERDAAAEWALSLVDDDRPVAPALELLLALDRREAAERLAVRRGGEMQDVFYTRLRDLGDRAIDAECPVIAVVCLRLLVEQILDAGRTKAYGYARRYCGRLERIETALTDRRGLSSHADFMASLRERHGRKHSFWRPLDAR